MENSDTYELEDESVAIIGMSGRFPGAKNLDEFWHNLKNGVESISFFSDQELLLSGIDPAVLADTNYVKAKGILDNVAEFDATFFDFNPREAEILDPQQRLFLECAWEALENAGYDPETYSGAIGVYGGVGSNTYLLENIYANPELLKTVDGYLILTENDKDFLCTRVSYKLNLCGPSVTVQTACSTSLVAVVMGCKSLFDYQCDMVLAGGVSISLPMKSGYLYQEGMIASPDGHCRAFDAKAQGTVGGNGVGIVVLKRLEDALNDGDTIHAVIKGAAINNDGALKIGYTAPSVDAQARVIVEALTLADISPETISYVEAHGTATPLGDPVEIAALKQAFQANTDKTGYCAIGSVKTNVGHLDTAAGVAGLIKTVLALKHHLIPPSLHFETPNSQLDLANSPFYVNAKLSEWKTNAFPRRAGVSSFGIGGTNAHVVLEEPPKPESDIENKKSNRPWQLLLLSAKTDTALETTTTQLLEHLKQHPNLNLADVAYTYQVGRHVFAHRRMLVCQTLEDAVTALETRYTKRIVSHTLENDEEPSVVFMFSGQGAQYVNMGLELYQTEPVFREYVDRCAEFLKPHLGLDLRTVLYPAVQIPFNSPLGKGEQNVEFPPLEGVDLKQTAITQPALFVIEYALAQLWMAWGVQPKAMIGHSIGEYVAACLAGVFTLEDALVLVAARGWLMQSVPAGAMLAVPLSEQDIRPLLNQNLDLSAINVPEQCVVSGTLDAVEQFAAQLAEQGLECQRLHTSHAFHSEMMSPILTRFLGQVQKIPLKLPKIPFLSNVTGTWISATEAISPHYWATHLRKTVRFAAGLQHILKVPHHILLEIGPGRTLSTFAKRHPDNVGQSVLTSLRHPKEESSDSAFLLNTLGQLWMADIAINWSRFYAKEHRQRLPLPTYPFERQRYWVEPTRQAETVKPQADWLRKKPDIADWFYIPSWKRTAPQIYNANALTESSCWLVFMDECGLGYQLVKRLEQNDQDVITVKVGKQFTRDNAQGYTLNPHQHDDYDALLKELLAQNKSPKTIIHLWTLTPDNNTESGLEFLDKFQNLGFYSLLFLAQALGKQNITDTLQIGVVSNHLQAVTGEEMLCPEKATVLGSCKVIVQEYPNITCHSIDVVLPQLGTWQANKLIEALLAELTVQKASDLMVAYRGLHRWVQTFEPIRIEPISKTPRLTEKGVYLITGGLGGIGLVLAEYLARTVQARLILIGRSAFPNRDNWEKWLATHDGQDNVSRKIRKVQALENLGAEVLIVSADVANQQQMQEVLTAAKQQFGSINGVIHAAGMPDGALILRQTRDMTETVLAPKVKGTLVLDSLLRNVELDFFILCSSLASIFGIGGQIGYCAANVFLDTFAHRKIIQDGTFTVSINWDTWQQVGMAVKAANQPISILDIQNPDIAQEMSHPLFDYRIVDAQEKEIKYITHFSLNKHWVLSDHRAMGQGILPGTAYLEMVRAAFEQHAKNGTIEIRQVYFLATLFVGENEEREVRTILKPQGDHFEFSIESQINTAASQWQKHAWGEVTHIKTEPPKQFDLKAIKARCQKINIPEEVQSPVSFVEFGPRWQISLKQIELGKDEGLVLLELPEIFAADVESYKLHPALLDSAGGLANFGYFYPYFELNLPSDLLGTMTDFLKNEGVYYMPFSYHHLKIKGALPRKIYSYTRFLANTQSKKGDRQVNLTIMDEQGIELLEIENYILREVNLEKLTTKQLLDPNEKIPPVSKTPEVERQNIPDSDKTDWRVGKPLDSGVSERNTIVTNMLQQNLKEGLLPADGIEVFSRIMSSTLPQVLVSTRDLPSRLERNTVSTILSSLKESELAHLPQSAHSRPQLSNTYVAPRNELEQTITEVWQKSLGFESVGIFDDFFELGGDSLLAVQLIFKLRETLQTDLSAQVLLNRPTIAALVESIEKTTSISGSQPARPVLPSSLVEIQKGNELKIPWFLIHPLGGHIFIYRELTHYIGTEQPVYGLRAQGFEGEAEPLTRVEDMATLYIEAIRARQPKGPYFLGGISFGGMVAFEMAQQLHALDQQIALLMLVDSPGPGRMPVKKFESDAEFLDAEFLAYSLALEDNVSVSLSKLREIEPDKRLPYLAEHIAGLEFTQIHHYNLFKANHQAMWSYKPQVYPGKAIFFRAKEPDKFMAKNPELAWVDLVAGGLEIHDVPGNHITMNSSPHVEVMANRLKTYLDKV